MTDLTEKAIETDIDTLMKNPLVKIRIGNRCERTEKGDAFIKSDRLYVILGEDVETWQGTVTKAIGLVEKVKLIDEHNRNHPDLYQRIFYKLNTGNTLLDCM